MSARLVDSDITLLIAVLGGVADISKPTVTELTAGVNITCAVVAGYDLGMDASEEITGKGVCDKGKVVNFGDANYKGSLQFFLEAEDDATAATSAYIAAEEFFTTRGIKFDLFRRIGKASDVPITATDKVEGYGFVTDYPQFASGADASGYAMFTQPLAQQSRFTDGKVAVVGP
ncbi:hypothetical protein ART_0176 [Arthrobacter sp. PAMC 25486]|uniref:phage tail tube protein n=1 Tax=Arthrobacter sp. PAMC 25486 TaxID=1494608 RepID=UPI000535D50C|nr:hypothetical protein [Arthrobacter sp. PAMC 25486]AIX99774.1 hypothetical protein ART_0176 [Arthrobacter sp. PAMC 25486]